MGHSTSNHNDDQYSEPDSVVWSKEIVLENREKPTMREGEASEPTISSIISQASIEEPFLYEPKTRKPTTCSPPLHQVSSLPKDSYPFKRDLSVMKGSITKLKPTVSNKKGFPLVRVIQMSSPTLVTTKPEDFMSVVQQLTGSPSSYKHATFPLQDTSSLVTPLDFGEEEPMNMHLQRRFLVDEDSTSPLQLAAFDCEWPLQHHECIHEATPWHTGGDSSWQRDCSTFNDEYCSSDPISIELMSESGHSRSSGSVESSSISCLSMDACFSELSKLASSADPCEVQSLQNHGSPDLYHVEDSRDSPGLWDLQKIHEIFYGINVDVTEPAVY